MEENRIAKACGLRCRRARMARNMSQQVLADMMFTTPQNISKYEKEGISNIDTIQKLSEILGQNLLTDENDEEGVVGEIGKEILFRLIEKKGFYNMDELISGRYLYGMKTERITNEIFKLERIGMSVREQFNDFLDKERDVLFITAKGLITYKNLLSRADSDLFEDKLREAHSYEEIVGEAGSYQEYIELRPIEKIVRQLPYTENCYRINYITYLKRRYEELEEALDGKAEDHVIKRAKLYFEKEFSIVSEEPDLIVPEENMEAMKDSKYIEQSKRRAELEEIIYKGYKYYQVPVPFYDEAFEKHPNSAYPTDWFTAEEIKDFININLYPASNSEERNIDKAISEITHFYPEALNYFEFPKSWEENELAAMIRKNFNIN